MIAGGDNESDIRIFFKFRAEKSERFTRGKAGVENIARHKHEVDLRGPRVKNGGGEGASEHPAHRLRGLRVFQ